MAKLTLEFEKGDRVQMLDSDYRHAPKGATGTVMDDCSLCPDVCWDHSGEIHCADHSRLQRIATYAPTTPPHTKPATADAIAVLIACGIITEAQADAARALVQS